MNETYKFLKENTQVNYVATINGDKVLDENMLVTKDMAIENKIVVIRRGKKKNYIGMFE